MNKIVVIVILYLLTLLAAIILPNGISDYNAYVQLFMCVVYVMLIRSFSVYVATFICWFPICIMSISHSSLLYILIDSALIFFIFGSLYASLNFSVKKRELRFFESVFFLVVLMSVAGILNPALYRDTGDGSRYMGLFHAINFSASVFSILGIAVWEIEKTARKRTWILFALVFGVLIYIWATTTRSLLFVLPYWLYQLSKVVNRKMLIAAVAVVCIFYMPVIINTILPKLRLEEDESSIMTRSLLYQELISGILDNYALIPRGAHAATTMVVNFTGDPRFSPHNDFLNYIYNWGGVFYVFCAMIIYRLRSHIKFNFEFYLILLAMAACALHNMLFAIYVWIPFIIILMVRKYSNIEKTQHGQ